MCQSHYPIVVVVVAIVVVDDDDDESEWYGLGHAAREYRGRRGRQRTPSR
jgi:hypothetical protein